MGFNTTTGHAKGATKSSNESASSSSSSSLSLPSAAPSLPTFEPPEPSQTDPYPGYYQLPSGVWASYDPEYYAKFMKNWEHEYNSQLRALEKGVIKGFEGLKDAPVEEIDALKEMEKAKKEIQEREEKKAVTLGAGGGPVAPKMNINVRCIVNWSAAIFFLTISSSFRRPRRTEWLIPDINCPPCSIRRIRTGKLLKSKSRKVNGIAKKLATSMVRNQQFIFQITL